MGTTARAGLRTILRDLASFGLGCSIIMKQAGIVFAPPSQPSELLIIVGAAIIGVPGAAQLMSSRSGGPPSTGGQPSPPAPAPLPASSPGESPQGGNQ